MSDIYFCLIDRRDFGELLFAEGLERHNLKPLRNVESLLQQPTPVGQSVLAVWSQDPTSGIALPNMLVCQDGQENDWAAWITTYAAKVRPFSAFMRLVTRSELEEILTTIREPQLNYLTWAVAGLIIGEVLAASRMPDKALEMLPLNAYESTLSFAMFRASAVYSGFRRWPQLVEAWEATRQATRQQKRSIESEAVARVCGTIIEAANLGDGRALLRPSDAALVQACREVLSLEEPDLPRFSGVPNFASTRSRMHGSREERVVAFSDFINDIEEPPPADRELVSFVLGYLASLIAPGTIQHSSVLEPVRRRYASATLWYGFCAGLGGLRTNSRNVPIGKRPILDLPGSAKWVARNLLRPETVLATPTCDVGFLELLALSRGGEDPLVGMTRMAQGTATIELAPAIWTVVNVSAKLGAGEPVRNAKEQDTLAAIGENLERLRAAYNDLVGNETGESRQRVLFQAKRKKR